MLDQCAFDWPRTPAVGCACAQTAGSVQRRAYKLKQWSDHEDFLEQVARLSGKLTKGGDADLNTAAKMVLLDWQKGKLPFYTTPAGYSAEPPAVAEVLPDVEEAPRGAVTVRTCCLTLLSA